MTMAAYQQHTPIEQHTTLHSAAVLPLKLSMVGPAQSLDGRWTDLKRPV